MYMHDLLNRTAAARRIRDYGLAWTYIIAARNMRRATQT